MSKQPMRVFEGTARPYEPFWKVRNAAEAESGEPEIEMYGFISEYSWWGDEITPAKFKEDLNAIGAGGPVTIRMNSGGGDVFAASVIRSILVEYRGRVTVRVDGLAASAATIVATAGDVVRMQDSAYFMIHDPIALAYGNIEELKQVLDVLKTVKEGIMDVYELRTEMSRERLARMMTDETWMSAREAVEMGFADEVISTKTKAAPEMAVVNALRMGQYQNMPEALRALLSTPVQPEEPAPDPEVIRLRAEVKLYV